MIPKFDRDDFILGDSIETPYGNVRFLKYTEYIRLLPELSLISMNSLHFYWQFKKSYDSTDSDIQEFLELTKKAPLYEIIVNRDDLAAIYLKIFKIVLDSHDRLEEIFKSEDLFMGMRKLIMDMNFLSEGLVSEEEEIQEYYDTRKKMQQKEAGKQSVSDVVSSIVAGTSNSFEDVRNMTVIQVYTIYYRLGAFKTFDAQTLFATVSEKVKIESWNKHIDLFAKEEVGIGFEEFNKQYGGLFN